MPRLSPLDPAQMSNSQKFLVDMAKTLGAPDPEIARILVRSEIGRIWLRAWTEGRSEDDRAGFYGLDLYNLSGSIAAVLDYLDRVAGSCF